MKKSFIIGLCCLLLAAGWACNRNNVPANGLLVYYLGPENSANFLYYRQSTPLSMLVYEGIKKAKVVPIKFTNGVLGRSIETDEALNFFRPDTDTVPSFDQVSIYIANVGFMAPGDRPSHILFGVLGADINEPGMTMAVSFKEFESFLSEHDAVGFWKNPLNNNDSLPLQQAIAAGCYFPTQLMVFNEDGELLHSAKYEKTGRDEFKNYAETEGQIEVQRDSIAGQDYGWLHEAATSRVPYLKKRADKEPLAFHFEVSRIYNHGLIPEMIAPKDFRLMLLEDAENKRIPSYLDEKCTEPVTDLEGMIEIAETNGIGQRFMMLRTRPEAMFFYVLENAVADVDDKITYSPKTVGLMVSGEYTGKPTSDLLGFFKWEDLVKLYGADYVPLQALKNHSLTHNYFTAVSATYNYVVLDGKTGQLLGNNFGKLGERMVADIKTTASTAPTDTLP